MTKGRNPHAGHRERMKQQFLTSGTENFLAHQILELLLFYAIPRRDTNPIAHALIDSLGSPMRVLKASEEELTRVPGVGTHTARFIRDFADFVEGTLENPPLQSTGNQNFYEKIVQFLLDFYADKKEEVAMMLLLNNSFDLIATETIIKGSIHSARVHPKELVKTALSHHASMVVIAHNHLSALAVPSEEDHYITHQFREYFDTMHITMLEHFLIAGDRYVGLTHSHSKSIRETGEKNFSRVSAVVSADAFRQLGSAKSSSKTTKGILSIEDSLKDENSQASRHCELFTRLLSYATPPETAKEQAAAVFKSQSYLQTICMQSFEWFEAHGISKNAATLLKLALPSYASCLLQSEKDQPLQTARQIGSAMVYHCMARDRETIYLLLLDDNRKPLSFTRVNDGSISAADVSLRRIAEMAYFNHAKYAVIAHNHPYGTVHASDSDIETTMALVQTLKMVDCTLLEHFIVAGSSFLPLLLQMYGKQSPALAFRDFYDTEMLQKLLPDSQLV